MCIYNKGNLLEKSMEGEATRLVPARLARKGNRDQKIPDEILRKTFDKGNRREDLWKLKQVR